MAHVSISGHHRVSNRSEEVGGKMVICVSGTRQMIGGFGVPDKGKIEAEDSGLI